MRPKIAVLAVLAFLLILFLKQVIAFFSTIFLILQIFPSPLKPLTFLAREPVVERVEFSYNSRKAEGKLTRPQGEGKHPALILALAVKTKEQDEPEIDNFAQGAARLGFVVLVPHSEDLQEGRIKIEDKDTLVGAFEYLAEKPWVDEGKVSYVGISAGSSLALKAAEDPAVSEKLKSVVFFGGYFDAKDYFSSLISGMARYNQEEIVWQPDPGALWHAKEVIISLAPEEERATLSSVLHEGKSIPSQEQKKLSPESQFAIKVFAAKTPSELEQVWQEAPQTVDEHLERLSPSSGIESVKTRLFILHDRGDRYVSYTESRKLSQALAQDVDQTFLEVSLFEHVQPKGGTSPAILWDFARLFLFGYQAILFLS